MVWRVLELYGLTSERVEAEGISRPYRASPCVAEPTGRGPRAADDLSVQRALVGMAEGWCSLRAFGPAARLATLTRGVTTLLAAATAAAGSETEMRGAAGLRPSCWMRQGPSAADGPASARGWPHIAGQRSP